MSVCFDIGANIGLWSIENLKKYNYDKIISLEASPFTYSKLLNNVHSINNIIPLQYAVSSKDKNITFYHCLDADTISTTNKDWLDDVSSRFYGSKFKEIIVPTITIDSLIQQYGLPDLIKIDVEGAEYDVIQSLTQKVPIICFEWASELLDIILKSLDYLETIGFTKFFIQFGDAYTFRPKDDSWTDKKNIILILNKTQPKLHMGMIWAT